MRIVLLESLGVSDEILQECVKPLIEAGHSLTAFEKNTDIRVQIERAKEADIIVIANMPLKAEVILACEHLKFIDIAFTGVDHIDLEAAKKKGIKVSNAAGYSTQAVAELTICQMLSLLRRVSQVEVCCRKGQTKDGLVGSELMGRTIGIIGVGAIGERVAKLCEAFGCKVLGYKRHINETEPAYIKFVSLKELLKNADIVSLHCPLNEESYHLINKETIKQMKKGAYLINAARGAVIDSEAVAEALNHDYLAGAGIDVFETEPPLDTSHPLLHSKNTLVTPHIAFASKESMITRAKIVFDNIQKWIEGNQINAIL